MKIKRTFCLLLAFLILPSLAACGQGSQPEATKVPISEHMTEASEPSATESVGIQIPANEYERGIWYGFMPQELESIDPASTTVTWKQYCEMLGKMIAVYDESKLPQWERMTAEAPDTEILRDGAALANLFAARTIGMDYLNKDFNDLYVDTYDMGYHVSWEYPIFDWESEFVLEKDEISDWSGNAIAPAFWFLLGRVSCVTCQPTLSVENGDPHFEEPLMLSDALVSVVRLYESDEEVVVALAEKLMEEIKNTSEAQAIVQAAESRKQEILNSKAAIIKSEEYIQGETYTGTAYYISNNGNDSNDGLSPETAWASLDRLENVKFQFGDAIFFERGSLWRSAQISKYIYGVQGLTLSAYGEGEKPRFYGSPENGTGTEKWELVYEGANGEKIWKFYKEMTDCSGVILDGKYRILRDIAYFDGGNFVSIDDLSTPYVMEEQLENMECFTELPYTMQPIEDELNEANTLGLSIHQDADGNELTGPIYVRYDAGNPGTLHKEVEFIAACSAFGGMSDYTTLDNLSICYSTQTITSGYFNGVSSDYITIQNCETGWMGGGINYFTAKDNGASYPFHIDGGGFNANGSHITLQNCYSHHMFQESSALETFDGDPDPCTDIIIRDNVLEYVTAGLIVVNWEEDDASEHQLKNVLVENNYVLYSGMETLYNHKDPIYSESERSVHWPNRLGLKMLQTVALGCRRGGENYVIRNNTFAFSVGTLVDAEEIEIPQKPVFEGNTYAPLPGFSVYQELENPWGPLAKVTDGTFAVQTILGDSQGKLIAFD